MMHQIVLGSILIMVTVVVESIFIALAAKWLTANRERLGSQHSVLRNASLLGLVTLWLLAGISIGLWIWALLFLQIGEFDSMLDALYFASVSATTLGYGDSLLTDDWKLLSGFIAANGLILFSLNTAFLFETLRRLLDGER